jgi:hypothetical protein
MRRLNLGLVFSSFFLGFSAFGGSLTEKFDRYEIDWSNLTIRYYGVSSESEIGNDFRSIEVEARKDAARYAYASMKDILPKKHPDLRADAIKDEAKAAAERLVGNSNSYNTTYFADGSVQVAFENSLVAAVGHVELPRSSSGIANSGMENSEFTGVVFEVSGKIVPTATYKVVGGAGTVLFSAGDVSKSSFESHLMGRWFQRASDEELNKTVGNNPLVVAATAGSDGIIVVDDRTFQSVASSAASHLRSATIAINLKN